MIKKFNATSAYPNKFDRLTAREFGAISGGNSAFAHKWCHEYCVQNPTLTRINSQSPRI